jgi:DtxR family Mn-dependent transcriptional regulator
MPPRFEEPKKLYAILKMSDNPPVPTSTVEDYLKSILLEEQALEAKGAEPRGRDERVGTGQIAARLALSPGTVTAMVKALADSGLVAYEPYSGVRLTPSGRQLALHVLRRHRLLELFLVEVLHLDWSEVHDEAERLEHAASDRLIERIDEMLGFPAVDPHGDPIPTAGGVIEDPEQPNLLTCPVGDELLVARVSDQSPDFLQLVKRRGLRPGQSLRVLGRDEAADTVELELAGGERLSLGLRAASKILVVPA